MKYVMVHVFDVPYHADREYTYSVPDEYENSVFVGSVVIVPFGKSDRHRNAVVTATADKCECKAVKPIISVMNEYFSLDADMLSLCHFMKSQTLCTVGEAVRCVVPAVSMASKVLERYRITDKSPNRLSSEYTEIYFEIEKEPGITLDRLKARFDSPRDRLLWLAQNGYITRRVEIEEQDKTKYEEIISLAISKPEALSLLDDASVARLRGERQRAVICALCEFGTLTDKALNEVAQANRTTILTLENKGYVKIDRVPIMRDPYQSAKEGKSEDVVLNDEQNQALSTLKELYETGEPRGALLYGVTGSGKTSVIKKMIDVVVSSGRSVIVLVPEISLTPQTVSVFCGYYGERVAVIHSNLSQGERFDAYRKIKDGEIDVVIGTRSAVFAPLKNLGMIVIDEEQEHTYKSDTSPKYLAHDIARFRSAKSNALMLLASATPSLNSYYKATTGAYTLVKISKRYGTATLPDVIITDMKRERSNGNVTAFSTKLATLMARGLEDEKQAILFLNRRGYHSAVSCSECGRVVECPSCSVAMTYHSFRKIDEERTPETEKQIMNANGILRCHMCGHQMKIPSECKECHSADFQYVGFGTQKLEGDLEALFPSARTLRLDADTTTAKSSYERILGSFLNKEADVMIGTQMVTKGHNFPSVTLVGVILADMMLYTSDYRASERTFSMLTQVIGRAGRAQDKGVAVIQTNSPNDRTILYASAQDYESFYKNEIQIRRAYEFPPFCDIAVITLSSQTEQEVAKFSSRVMRTLTDSLTESKLPAIVYGPFDAPIYKLQGRYRKRIIIKCKLNKQIRELFSALLCKYSSNGAGSYISIDLNPSSL